MTATRRLAAILAADVVGYSRLMGVDEEGTLVRLKTLRREVIDPSIDAHHGRIVKTTGDGLLVEFASVVDSVRCAAALQRALTERNAGEEPARRIELRIGVNLGDIIVDGDDIHGDGVNVAARLEALAEPGSVYVSGTAHDHVRDKLDQVFEDLGERELKNIARKMRVYRIAASPAPAARPALPLPDKPSLVVLPFQNMSGDAEQEYFADGMTEEITTALSRIRQFFVIARNTAFTYKGKKLDLKQVGHELGVRYLLEGSVRKAGNRVRITGQLIDAESGTHLWADKFDSVLEDVFDLQDRVTTSVVGAIEPSIARAEIERSFRNPPESLQAYDLSLRANGELWPFTREGTERALTLARRAVEIDPRYGLAYSMIGLCLSRRRVREWADDEDAEREEGLRALQLAVQLAPDDSVALTYAGMGSMLLAEDPDLPVQLLDRALALNPNSAIALGGSALVRLHVGDYATAIDHATRALRLSPFDMIAPSWKFFRGSNHLLRGDLPEAIEWLSRSVQENPRSPNHKFYLACALAQSGRRDEAASIITDLAASRSMNRRVLRRMRQRYKDPAEFDRITQGIDLMGFPE